jgi:lysophospholipase L1-like esterase
MAEFISTMTLEVIDPDTGAVTGRREIDLRNGIILSAAPTATTAGRVGMSAYVTSGGAITAEFVCTGASGGVYTWVKKATASGGGEDSIFLAEYETTPYAEIRSAHNTGKIVILRRGNLQYVLAAVTSGSVIFTNVQGVTLSKITVSRYDEWVESSSTINTGSGGGDSIFYGKRASFYGDSLTEKNHHYTKGYHKWVQEILGLKSYNNYGHSGDRTEDTINKINSVTDDAHIIFVMIGVNDVQHETELGTFDGLEAGTVYGNLNTICVNLREKYPLTPIVFITPAAQTTYTSDIGVTMYDVVKAVREVCVKNGVVYYDNYTISGISPENITYWTTDGCHWNDKAHEMVGKNLAHFVKDTFHYLIDREEIEYSPFEGKTLTMQGYAGEQFHFTAIVPVDDDFTVGSKVRISLQGTNGVNVKNNYGANVEIFGDDTGMCSNNTWTGQFSDMITNDFTVDSNGNVSAENEFTLKEIPTTKNIKIIVYVGIEDLTADASFVIQSLSVTVNGKEKEILKVGGFYVDEVSTID